MKGTIRDVILTIVTSGASIKRPDFKSPADKSTGDTGEIQGFPKRAGTVRKGCGPCTTKNARAEPGIKVYSRDESSRGNSYNILHNGPKRDYRWD